MMLDLEQMAKAWIATWQPIETAPKDGTEILASDGGEYYLTAWEDGAWGMPDSMVYTPKLTHWTALLPLPEPAP